MALTAQDFGDINRGKRVLFRYLGTDQIGWVQGWRTWPAETTVIVQPKDQELGEDRIQHTTDMAYMWTHYAGGKNILCISVDSVWLAEEGDWKKLISKHPHKCPLCKRKALILATSVECANYDCANYKWTPTLY